MKIPHIRFNLLLYNLHKTLEFTKKQILIKLIMLGVCLPYYITPLGLSLIIYLNGIHNTIYFLHHK